MAKYHYFKCTKCGAVMETLMEFATVCTAPVNYRTSGVCGGGYKEITKKEYNQILIKLKCHS